MAGSADAETRSHGGKGGEDQEIEGEKEVETQSAEAPTRRRGVTEENAEKARKSRAQRRRTTWIQNSGGADAEARSHGGKRGEDQEIEGAKEAEVQNSGGADAETRRHGGKGGEGQEIEGEKEAEVRKGGRADAESRRHGGNAEKTRKSRARRRRRSERRRADAEWRRETRRKCGEDQEIEGAKEAEVRKGGSADAETRRETRRRPGSRAGKGGGGSE